MPVTKTRSDTRRGTTCGIRWTAKERTTPARSWWEVELEGPEGTIRRRRRFSSGHRTPVHSVASIDELQILCLRYHLQLKEQDDAIPVRQTSCSDVHDLMRKRRVGPYRHEARPSDIQTEQHPDGTLHHSLR